MYTHETKRQSYYKSLIVTLHLSYCLFSILFLLYYLFRSCVRLSLLLRSCHPKINNSIILLPRMTVMLLIHFVITNKLIVLSFMQTTNFPPSLIQNAVVVILMCNSVAPKQNTWMFFRLTGKSNSVAKDKLLQSVCHDAKKLKFCL